MNNGHNGQMELRVVLGGAARLFILVLNPWVRGLDAAHSINRGL